MKKPARSMVIVQNTAYTAPRSPVRLTCIDTAGAASVATRSPNPTLGSAARRSVVGRGLLALLVVSVCFLVALPASAQELIVKRNTKLVDGPSSTAAPVRELEINERVVLEEPAPTDNYWHVHTEQNERGWAFASDVAFAPTPKVSRADSSLRTKSSGSDRPAPKPAPAPEPAVELGQPMFFWILALLPGGLFLVLGWTHRSRLKRQRSRVLQLLQSNEAVRKSYAEKYAPEAVANSGDLSHVAELRSGPFRVALGITFLICTLLSALAFVRVGIELPGMPAALADLSRRLDSAALYGFLGAYVWTLYECLLRFRSQNWNASAQNFIWLRLIIGTAIGSLATHAFKDAYAPILAFGVGAFPTETLRRWVVDQVEKTLHIDPASNLPIQPAWSVIQGASAETVTRLDEADVSTPLHLATADPVLLFLRTNIAWRTLLDLTDQALLAIYLGDNLPKVRLLGIRGSIEMAVLHSRLNSNDSNVQQTATAAVRVLAQCLSTSEEGIRQMAHNLFEDFQVNLIWHLWNRDPASQQFSETQGSSATEGESR